MRINKIKLVNFGSYEGENEFEMYGNDQRNIVIIGGKNGAGKTTLFTAMRLCLYGHLSMGYKTANSFYTRSISKLINNRAKVNRPATSSVTMSIDLSNGRGMDQYVLARSWTLQDSITEEFTVKKNGTFLATDEIANFEKYLISLIPPELFNLYFFDGEKIADFFLNEGSNKRIKEAFLTLCGYDTFEIMRKNFTRIRAAGALQSEDSLNEYISAKRISTAEGEKLDRLQEDLSECIIKTENCDSEISALEKYYTNKGGITEEEWKQKLILMREEERKREGWNNLLRKWANDVIPFIMIAGSLRKVKNQITKENSNQKLRNFLEILNNDAIVELLDSKKEAIEQTARSLYEPAGENILDLSFEQSALLLGQLDDLLAFDEAKVMKCKRLIKQSINRSAKLRKELEQSSIATVHEYMHTRSDLLEKKANLLSERISLEKEVGIQKDRFENAKSELERVKTKLEAEIKKKSINDISARAIVMLDKLQTSLYHRQIEKVEDAFRNDVSVLMRKSRFIDDIYIDDDFRVHVFRNEEFSADRIKKIIVSNTEDQFIAIFGKKALDALRTELGEFSFGKLPDVCNGNSVFNIPVEIDKSSFSNGEKQVFIMALYHSLVKLGNHDIPFVIDTPFARIDTEHRANITRHFFCELKGQVFILSTNEEINASHLEIMKDKILAKYMLENTDNQRTVIVKDLYFED